MLGCCGVFFRLNCYAYADPSYPHRPQKDSGQYTPTVHNMLSAIFCVIRVGLKEPSPRLDINPTNIGRTVAAPTNRFRGASKPAFTGNRGLIQLPFQAYFSRESRPDLIAISGLLYQRFGA